ncbi:MAG: hypothetical protein PHN82_04400 [bacterium]|nr:hypothetical protein [bacterium]
MKRFVAAVLVVSFGWVGSALPVLAGGDTLWAERMASEPAATAPADAPMVHVGEKNPTKAGLMSLIVPCTGQWYNGQLKHWKTATMAAIEAGSIFVLVYFLARGPRGVAFAGMGGMIANHAWSGWDAWNTANKMNQGLALEFDRNRTMVSYNIPF